MENAGRPHQSRLELARLRHPGRTDAEHVRAISAQVIDDLTITEPPVDVEMVASSLGISAVTIEADLPVAGCLLRHDDGGFEILVRGTDPSTRQRFTACHECSHTYFPGYATRAQYRCSPTSPAGASSDLEMLCDIAASELLFPSTLFVPDADATPFSFNGLEELADQYHGSLEATARRLIETRREAVAVLILTARQKPAELGTNAPPQLRLDYALRVGDWPYFMPHKSVAPGGVFDRALHGETVSEITTITDVCSQSVRAEVHARFCPLTLDGAPQNRVLALARRRWT